MRFTIWLVGILATLYGGYWFVGSSTVEDGAVELFDSLRADGLELEYSAFDVRGFPSRFDTTLSEPEILDPATGFGWSGSFLQVFALSYQPNKVIAIFPPDQTITLPDDQLTLNSEGMRASVGAGFSMDVPLNAITLEAQTAALTSQDGWTTAAENVLMAFRASGPAPNAYDVYLGLDEVALPVPVRAVMDPNGARAGAFELVRLDAQVILTEPLNRETGNGEPPEVVSLNLRNLQFRWAGMDLSAKGDLVADPMGFASGTLTVSAVNWREIIAVARGAGVMPDQTANMVELSFAAISTGEGADAVVSTPISFENGEMRMGFFPLGPAPRLR